MSEEITENFWNHLKYLLQSEESETLEFKSSIPTPDVLAREIIAFANTKGGYIIIGITEDKKIKGINIEKLKHVYESTKSLISPFSIGKLYTPEIDGKYIAVIELPTIASPLYNRLPSGAVYQRKGSQTVPISAQHVVEKFKEFLPIKTTEEILAHVSKLAIIIESLNNALEKGNSWQSKSKDMIIGGIIGALISIILGFLLSLF